MPSAPEGKVIVALSGGVDSAVAALRLLRAGCEVEALFMKNWEEDDDAQYCAAAEDLAAAQAVCTHLGIRLHTVNFASEYWDSVFTHFLAELQAGRTPNPDVLCNREIKFKVFLEHAQRLGAARIATGHYARLQTGPAAVQLCLSADEDKDQTYFLHAVPQAALAQCLFPLGGLTKRRVRALAAKASLPNHGRADSTGLCFIGERRFRSFISRWLPATPGPIVSVDGRRLGEHRGLMFHTIGQRKGLGIGGIRGGSQAPWYVVEKRLHDNTLVVAQGHDHPALFRTRLRTLPPHWIAGHPPGLPASLRARLRHRHALTPCTVHPAPGGGLDVHFATPQRAITPGQSVVFYDGEVCLGGAVIE